MGKFSFMEATTKVWLLKKRVKKDGRYGNHQLCADGGTYGFASYVIFYPEINSGVVILSK